MSTFVVPNVGSMTTTGLTQQAFSIILQNLVLQALGITPSGPTDSVAYSQVRIDWPTPGQPGFVITDDVAFIRAIEVPDAFNYAHEVQPVAISDTSYPDTTIYTRVWEVGLIFYGPHSFDRARQVKACLFQDFAHDILALSNVYIITTLGTPRRAPELFANQWWERTDFSVRMNEQVTDTLTKPTMASVEIILEAADAIVGDITISLE